MRLRGLIGPAVVAKVIQVAQRELRKPENQRKLREGFTKLQQRTRKP
ncbi:MAG TPA: hypothetical protein VEQ66_09320 [Propionibacteriaceae bacterium]|nr:hypothetical protein [Propionibacteriaceae bacterium]